jgi:hypothetical protein
MGIGYLLVHPTYYQGGESYLVFQIVRRRGVLEVKGAAHRQNHRAVLGRCPHPEDGVTAFLRASALHPPEHRLEGAPQEFLHVLTGGDVPLELERAAGVRLRVLADAVNVSKINLGHIILALLVIGG